MKTGKTVFIILSLILVFSGTTALADDGRRVPGEEDIGRVRKKVEAVRAWRLTEELDLDEDKTAKLFPAMRRSDRQRQEIEADNRRIIRMVSAELNKPNPAPEVIDSALEELVKNRRRTFRSEEEHLQDVRKILSPEDTARYLLFQVKFQKEIRERVMRSRRGGMEHGGPSGGMRSGNGGRDR